MAHTYCKVCALPYDSLIGRDCPHCRERTQRRLDKEDEDQAWIEDSLNLLHQKLDRLLSLVDKDAGPIKRKGELYL